MRDATDLAQLIGEHIPLQPKGREHIGLCPFHEDRKPSLTVVTHKGNGFYKCFSCGATGDAFTFVMQYHRKEFGEALHFLADRAGIALQPRSRTEDSRGEPGRAEIRRANEFAAAFFSEMLTDPGAGRAARDLIQRRGISDAMVELFGMGAAPDSWDRLLTRLANKPSAIRTACAAGLIQARTTGGGHYDVFRNRLIFPICDELGVPVAFGGRTLETDDTVKYINSPESAVFSKSKVLYGLHLARRSIIEAGRAIVTEGYTDVIACHQAGFENVVGTLGTALTRGQARRLGRLCDTVVLVFDGDEAGRRAADRAVEVFFHEPVDVKICVLPEGVDPDELLRRTDGRDRFEADLAGATDALAYKFERFRARLADQDSISGRQKQFSAFLEELSNLGFGSLQGVRKRGVMLQLADLLGLTVDELQRMLPRKRQMTSAAAASEPSAQPDPSANVTGDLLAAADASAGLSRARRLAEHELLALIIHDPELGRLDVLERDGAAVNVASAFRSEDFQDSTARRIAEILLPRLHEDAEITVPKLHAAIDDEHCRRVTSQMYFDGQQSRTSFDGTPEDLLRLAAAALEDHHEREGYDQLVRTTRRDLTDSHPDSMQALNDLLERRRRQATVPAAISQGVRSTN